MFSAIVASILAASRSPGAGDPAAPGLAGWSDADVVSHAIADAMLLTPGAGTLRRDGADPDARIAGKHQRRRGGRDRDGGSCTPDGRGAPRPYNELTLVWRNPVAQATCNR